jgi:hypothetical protein
MFRAPFLVNDPGSGGTITVDRWGSVVPIVTAGAEARTLAQPTKAGLVCTIVATTAVGAITLTVTGGWNADSDTTMTLGDAGDFVTFVSIKVSSSYYWRVVAQEGIIETVEDEIDIHGLTALAAAPDVADLVAVSDESATNDPPRAVTVTELLTAAGDLTDLGAVPAVDDRILLTDESAAGDPAKSTTVENLFSALGDVTALGAAPATDDILVVTDESAAGDPIKAITVAQLFQTYTDDMTEGTGISGATGETCEHCVTRIGGLYKTEIVIDLATLNSGGTAGDIIGKADTANCHIGQITAAKNGTIFAGRMTCLEAPTTGDDDIDLYSATESTGTEDTGISGLTATQLCNSGDLTAGTHVSLTAFPAADKYLYLVAQTGDSNATYATGILQIELWGK